MRKILFICNHLQYSDGVAACLRNLVNALSDVYKIDILNIYKYDASFANDISSKVEVYNYFGRYFKGLRSFVNRFLLGLISRHRVFKKEKYDIIISYQYGTPSNLLAYIKKHRIQQQAKTVGVIHGFAEDQLHYYKELDTIISISEDGRLKAKKCLPEYRGKLVHLRNLYSVDQISQRSKEDNELMRELKNKGKIIFCTVSRLTEEKGVDRFVKALKKYHDSNPNVVGVIVGDGPLFAEITKLIHELVAESFIFMVGAQTNPYPYIMNSDFYCCSSKSEGLCTSCVEASILGTPIVSTNVSGAKEIVEEPTIGCIVDNTYQGVEDGIQLIAKMKFKDTDFESSKSKWDPIKTKESYVRLFESL